jgi:ADP-ribose pyrophosphatase
VNVKPLAAHLGWLLGRSSCLYKGRWFTLREEEFLRSGEEPVTYTYIEHPGSVFVVPVTPDGRLLLMRQYRFTMDAWCWEIPAGTMADAHGLSASQVALRELREELGAECGRLQHIGQYYLGNGYAKHIGEFFLALDIQLTRDPQPNASEQIVETKAVSSSEVLALIQDGTVNDGDSAFALLLALNHFTVSGGRVACLRTG